MKVGTETLHKILTAIKKNQNCNIMSINFGTELTYSHICRVKKILEEKKLIKSIKIGRSWRISLTDRGEDLLGVIMKYKEYGF